MTVGICYVGYAALNAYARPNSAMSAEARAVTQAVSAIVRSAENSQILFGTKAAAISRLMVVSEDCSKPGWDGDQACAIDQFAIQTATDFVRALPESFPLPEFAPEPDGSISLDWIESRHRLFSLSIGKTNRLAYAWLDGTDKGHGVARFDASNVPSRVLSGIESILNHGNTCLRAA